jgi:hypothetical protein
MQLLLPWLLPFAKTALQLPSCYHFLCRRAISTWRATLQQSKAVAALQLQHNQRKMAAVLAAWAQAAWEQRCAATPHMRAGCDFGTAAALGLLLSCAASACCVCGTSTHGVHVLLCKAHGSRCAAQRVLCR